MSVSRRVIHHGLYFAVLGPLIGVLFLVLGDAANLLI